MLEFVAKYSDKVSEGTINDDLYTRGFDKPLEQCIIDSCKGLLNVVPGLEFIDAEFETDMSKIHMRLNKRIIKDKSIKNNDNIRYMYNINETYYGMLTFNIKMQRDSGEWTLEKRSVFIPMKFMGNYFLINGNLALPTLQVVNNSTYVVKNDLKFKTSLFPLSHALVNKTIVDEVSKETFKTTKFTVDLFGKTEYNPFLFYIAQMGIEKLLKYFEMDGIVNIVTEIYDPRTYYYFRGSKNILFEVNKEVFDNSEIRFVRQFVATMIDLMRVDKNLSIVELFDQEFWTFNLGGIFGKPSVRKGSRSLLSFGKMLDTNTKKSLKLDKHNKRDSFALDRWLMTNYAELVRKDNLNIDNNRIRVNEYLAYYFDNAITININSIFNGDKITESHRRKLLNAINPWMLIRAIRKGTKSGNLLNYERFNDFDAILYGAYSEKGPSGQKGGKHKTKLDSRNVNPSHLCRYDLNVCSANDPGLTGAICSNVKLYNGTHFSNEPEPQSYFKAIAKVRDECDIDFDRSRKLMESLKIDAKIFNTETRMYTLSRPDERIMEYIRALETTPFRQGDQLDADGMRITDEGLLTFVRPIQLNKEGLVVLDWSKKMLSGMHKLDFEKKYFSEKNRR